MVNARVGSRTPKAHLFPICYARRTRVDALSRPDPESARLIAQHNARQPIRGQKTARPGTHVQRGGPACHRFARTCRYALLFAGHRRNEGLLLRSGRLHLQRGNARLHLGTGGVAHEVGAAALAVIGFGRTWRSGHLRTARRSGCRRRAGCTWGSGNTRDSRCSGRTGSARRCIFIHLGSRRSKAHDSFLSR